MLITDNLVIFMSAVGRVSFLPSFFGSEKLVVPQPDQRLQYSPCSDFPSCCSALHKLTPEASEPAQHRRR